LYSTLTQFGTVMKLVKLTKMCLSETYSKVRKVQIYLMHLLFRMV